MENIAIITSGSGTRASRLFSFFADGNRAAVSCVLTDSDSAARSLSDLASQADGLKAEILFFSPEIWEDNPATILHDLQAHKVSMLVTDDFDRPLPADLTKAYSGSVLDFSLSDDGATATVCRTGDDAIACDTILSGDASDDEGVNILLRAIVKAMTERQTPPSPPSISTVSGPDEEWAQALGIPNPQTPPPVPDYARRQTPGRPGEASEEGVQPISDTSQPSPAPQHSFGPAQHFGQQPHPGSDPNRPPMPKTYMVWSIIAILLCCFIPAIVAIIYSSQVNSKYYSGDYEGAERASRNAQIWIIISFVLGLVGSTLYIPIMIIGG